MDKEREVAIRVEHLTMAYGSTVVVHDVDFTVWRGEVFCIIGGSGSGKSTLLRHLLGLEEPAAGNIFYGSVCATTASEGERKRILRRVGVLYQGGALFSSMTVADNISLPLDEYTKLSDDEIRRVARVKLRLVGLAGFDDYEPAQLSGGMQKRAGLARAIALDPDILYLDEPSAGLDPVNARRLDDLILNLRAGVGGTVVVVTHELASIFRIGDRCVFLDGASHRQIACGSPRDLLASSKDPRVLQFLTRGGEYHPPERPHGQTDSR
jgi:phospholipid/cholesterol/gamma-HCH transport system ATP-binding protein